MAVSPFRYFRSTFLLQLGSWESIQQRRGKRVELYARLDEVRLEPTDLLAAIDLHRLHRFSIWDALILRAAAVAGCRVLYTEGLQPGFRLDNLEVVNPFRR